MLKPRITDSARPFWEAIRDHRLVIQHCDDCEQPMHPPMPVCPSCASASSSWREVSGHGTVYSYSIVHRPPRHFEYLPPPYAIGIVQLDDADVRVVSNLVTADGGSPVGSASSDIIGRPTRTVYHDVDAEFSLFRFELCEWAQ